MDDGAFNRAPFFAKLPYLYNASSARIAADRLLLCPVPNTPSLWQLAVRACAVWRLIHEWAPNDRSVGLSLLCWCQLQNVGPLSFTA